MLPKKQPWVPRSSSTQDKYPAFLKPMAQYMHDYQGMAVVDIKGHIEVRFGFDVHYSTITYWVNEKTKRWY